MSGLRQLGRALVAPLLQVGRGYNSLAQRWPQSTAIITTTVKTSAADAFAQLVIEDRKTLDLKRHAMFCSFGFVYLGVWQYYLYNTLFARWCKSITKVVGHMGSAPVKTFLDQALHHPFIYFPAFYVVKGYVQQRTPRQSLEACYTDMWDNLKALWAVWVPAQLINFSVVPVHLRIPFVAAVSFLWTIIISNLRGQMEEPEPSAVISSSSSSSEGGLLQVQAAAAADCSSSKGSPLLQAQAPADSADSALGTVKQPPS